MTGKPLPNVYDDTVLDRDLKGTPDPVVQASLPHGDDVFRAEEHDHGDLTGAKLNDPFLAGIMAADGASQDAPRIQTLKLRIGGGSELAAMLDGLLGTLLSGQMHGLDDEEITLDDVVDKYKSDVSAALSVLCRGDASSIQINRTLRDGVNTKRKLVVKFSAEMQEVYDDFQ